MMGGVSIDEVCPSVTATAGYLEFDYVLVSTTARLSPLAKPGITKTTSRRSKSSKRLTFKAAVTLILATKRFGGYLYGPMMGPMLAF
eukprot:1187807-Prorocentrum_minimum.AAC.2